MSNQNQNADLKNPYDHLPHFTPEFQDELLNELRDLISKFRNFSNYMLTSDERRRLIGSGIRNYGFLDKTSDLATVHTEYFPPLFNLEDYKAEIRDVEFCRNLLSLIDEFSRTVSNSLLVYGDGAFRMALRFYISVRELARTGNPGAITVFEMLRPYFRRRRASGEPTEHEVERDIHALLHGTKDGKAVIENERPHLEGGKHLIADETHKDKTEFKEKITE
jgi:hypothetical protein